MEKIFSCLEQDIINKCLKDGETLFIKKLNKDKNIIVYDDKSLVDIFKEMNLEDKRKIILLIDNIKVIHISTKKQLIEYLIDFCEEEIKEILICDNIFKNIEEDIIKKCTMYSEDNFVELYFHEKNIIYYNGKSYFNIFKDISIVDKQKLISIIYNINDLNKETKDKIIINLLNFCNIQTKEELETISNGIDDIIIPIKDKVIIMTNDKKNKIASKGTLNLTIFSLFIGLIFFAGSFIVNDNVLHQILFYISFCFSTLSVVCLLSTVAIISSKN